MVARIDRDQRICTEMQDIHEFRARDFLRNGNIVNEGDICAPRHDLRQTIVTIGRP